jgi:anti-sigma regulatory factor (Ser/Thr protein kinase)
MTAALSDSPIRLAITSTPAHLPVVRAALERVAELMGFDQQARGQMVLAVDEALTNVIRHAYHGEPGRPIEIAFLAGGGPERVALRVEIRDWGERAAPEEIRPRDLADIRPGGLGVHIMLRCMDSVQYAAAPGGGTCLTMTKLLKARSDQ